MMKLHESKLPQYEHTFQALKRDDDDNKMISLHLKHHTCLFLFSSYSELLCFIKKYVEK